ncbi:receiver/sensor box histidine kinase [Natronomonas pharaonis DSM 2160]|uniref:histidine kinase n=1 Tax=Natronomonas pharaonis (strain ATCC 35678 / DSM 2160 / CIP 103997 / JCM 8858 / NBRC 14720 / NCIMB 2260 / Gabara) TaxID=348780 RepID=A0A1U7EZD6_NATPD|nr:PAS domain S-box protein [Natronomonas pharaonis]CAI50651.1 receiver/sensor box histidine kinase [Natronomonas pharaonis DSM 2160]
MTEQPAVAAASCSSRDGVGSGDRTGAPASQSPLSIVYVATDPDDSVSKRLSDADGLAVETVDSAQAALDYLEAHRVDGVVCRHAPPTLDGLALLSRLDSTLPVVLVAADGSERLASDAIAAGVADYVPLPDDGDPGSAFAERVRSRIRAARDCLPAGHLEGIEAAVEHAADAIVVTDADGTIEYANPAFEDLTGYTRQEAIGHTPRILKSGRQDDAYYEELWDAILSGDVWNEEILNETKDGRRYIAHQTIAPILGDDGDIRKFVGIQRDVTEKRRLETQVQQANEALDRLYDSSAATDNDIETKIQRVLEMGADAFDYPLAYATRIEDDTQEIIAAVGDHEHIQTGATDPLCRTYCRRTIERDEPLVVGDAIEEGWAGDPAFERFGLRCYVGARVVVDGDVVGTVCFGGEKPRDRIVLEIQQSTVKTLAKWLGYELRHHRYERRLRRQNERLETVASVVSHDLRNPLNVARGSLELARETGDDDTFGRVADAHDRMESIIDDTLALVRGGALVEGTSPVSLATVAERCWQHVDTADATLSVDDDTTIEADPDRIDHAFENLFANSVTHAGPDVTVRVGPTADGFYVEDDGPGIPEAEREQIFEQGYTGGNGTGLGLAIVAAVTNAHGWSVSVTESDDGGARFEFDTSG